VLKHTDDFGLYSS